MIDPEKKDLAEVPSTIVDGDGEKEKTAPKPRGRRRRTPAMKQHPVTVPAAECIVLRNLCIGRDAVSPEYDAKGYPIRKTKIPGRHIARLRNKGVIK